MRIFESWRFAVKCIKLSYNLKVSLFAAGLLGVMGLVYELGNSVSGVGAVMLLTVAMYPAQLLYSVCGSDLVQSSPYKKSMMTSIPTVITFCSSMIMYLPVLVLEGARSILKPETMGHNIRTVLLCGLMLLVLQSYLGIAYKNFVIPMLAMAVFVVGIYNLMHFADNGTLLLSWISGITMPTAMAVGLGCAVLGSLLQYGLSLLLYKKPISRTAMYGLLRQQS